MEQSIDLRNTTNFLVNLDADTDRLAASTKVLDSLQIPFDRFSAIKHEKGLVGCGMSHHRLLSSIKPNTLILEDDIADTGHASNILPAVPEGVDAIYLGVSRYGFVNKPFATEDTVLAANYDENYKKIFNMCSTHAILYLSQRYIDACSRIIQDCLDNNIPFDLGLATLHRYFNILTPKQPMFYQSDQAWATHIVLPT
jgi:GR25 family glycosyltransferase involved in LPS biosynthesis